MLRFLSNLEVLKSFDRSTWRRRYLEDMSSTPSQGPCSFIGRPPRGDHRLDRSQENRTDLPPKVAGIGSPKDLTGHPGLLHFAHRFESAGVFQGPVGMLSEDGRDRQVHIVVLPGHGDAFVRESEVVVVALRPNLRWQELVSAMQQNECHGRKGYNLWDQKGRIDAFLFAIALDPPHLTERTTQGGSTDVNGNEFLLGFVDHLEDVVHDRSVQRQARVGWGQFGPQHTPVPEAMAQPLHFEFAMVRPVVVRRIQRGKGIDPPVTLLGYHGSMGIDIVRWGELRIGIVQETDRNIVPLQLFE